MEELKKRIGLDYDRLSRMSIIEEGAVKVLLKHHDLVNCYPLVVVVGTFDGDAVV